MTYLKSWTFGKHALSCLMLSIVIYKLFSFVFPRRQAASIGIIGGADGPTAIFLTGKLLSHNLLVYIGVFILLLMLYFPLSRWMKP